MTGLAKTLFINQYSKSPWKRQVFPTTWSSSWPILEALAEAQCVGYVDLAFAKRLLEKVPEPDEACGALLCHLSMAARQGHLCISIGADGTYPRPEDIWIPPANNIDNGDRYSRLLHKVSQLIHNGSKNAPSLLVSDADDSCLFPIAPICRQGDRYYLQRYWLQETMFLEHAISIISERSRPTIPIDKAFVEAEVDILTAGKLLLPEQARAIKQGCCRPFTIITGGPGTGKTHTAGQLLRVFWKSLAKDKRQLCSIALAAPTGKAASNLEASIGAALNGLEDFPIPSAQTLHTLLGIGKERRNRAATVLPYDLVIVDESSMIDARIMGHLLAGIKPGARLIMLGDRHQLPPVEAGSLFGDLADFLQSHSEKYENVIELKQCLRTELQEIVALADAIKRGDEQAGLRMLNDAPAEGGIRSCFFENGTGWKEQHNRLLNYCIKFFPNNESLLEDPLVLLKEFSRFRVLTPLRKGPLGVETLNGLFHQAALKRARSNSCFVAPILIVQNDPRLELFNGEIGLLVQPHLENGSAIHRPAQPCYALFAAKSKEKGSVRKIPLLMLPKFEYAYCLSVHKSQGSEFEHVVMVLPEGSERFGRETLYTGITRARKSIEIWGTSDIMRKMIGSKTLRHSGIKERLAYCL